MLKEIASNETKIARNALEATMFFNGSTDNDLFHTSADLALKTIHEAESEGANVSELVENFNEALNLMDQAKKSKFDTCGSYEDCNQQAITILLKITNDGHVLKEQAKETYALHRFAKIGRAHV